MRKKLNYKNVGLALIMLTLITMNILILKNIAAFYNHIGLALYMFSGTATYTIGLYFNDYLKEKEKKYDKKQKKAYIVLNYLKGWKVVLDDVRVVDCTKPIFNSNLISDDGLRMCKKFCNNNNIQVVRVCK